MNSRAQSHPTDRHQEAGFTLVELLVALMLLGLMSLVLVGSLRLGIGAWKRGAERSEWVDATLIVHNHLRRLIGEAYPFYSSNDPTRGHIDFEGTPTSLGFLAPTPIALGGAGRSRFTLLIDGGESRSNFVIISKPELAVGEDDATVAAKRILLANVEAVDFAYFGRADSDRDPAWHRQWMRQVALPQIVRIQVRFPAGDARHWPDLFIAPRISADVSCIYDLLSKRCRGR